MTQPVGQYFYKSLKDEFHVRFGAAVRERRKALGWTRPELALRIGSQASTLYNIENGASCPLFVAWRLAAAFRLGLLCRRGQKWN